MRAAWTVGMALGLLAVATGSGRFAVGQGVSGEPRPVLNPRGPILGQAGATTGAVTTPPNLAVPAIGSPVSSLFAKDPQGDSTGKPKASPAALPPLPPAPATGGAEDEPDADAEKEPNKAHGAKDEKPTTATAKTKSETASQDALAKFKLHALKMGEKHHGPPADLTEANSLKIEATAKLKVLDALGEKVIKPGQKSLRDVYRQRLTLIEAWNKAIAERMSAEHPDPDPDRLAAEHKVELERTRAMIENGKKTPDSVLPQAFQKIPARITEAVLNDLKEGIDAAKNDLQQRTKEVDAARARRTQSGPEVVTALRAERDKIHQRISTLIPRRKEREDALTAANNDEAKELARERLTNFDWEAQVERERLLAKEAQIALDSKRVDEARLFLQLKAALVTQADQVVQRVQSVYASVVERQSRELQKAVAEEKAKAARADDPIAKFRARRKAELLDLESVVLAYKKEFNSTPKVAEEQQTKLANRAEEEFGQLKARLDDGETSRLDLLRLNNDLRRIAPEKDAIERTELATISGELTTYENALTDAELELANDDRDDRLEQEAILEQLPKERRAEARDAFVEIEGKHRTLLYDRKEILKKLADRAESTHRQVQRRLTILEEQDAFIRTQIYWVRDEEPITSRTWSHARSDIARLAWAGVRLVQEPFDRTLWGKVSGPFLILGSLALVFPLPLWWLRRQINRFRVADNLPAPHPAAMLTPSGSPKLTDSGVVAQV